MKIIILKFKTIYYIIKLNTNLYDYNIYLFKKNNIIHINNLFYFLNIKIIYKNLHTHNSYNIYNKFLCNYNLIQIFNIKFYNLNNNFVFNNTLINILFDINLFIYKNLLYYNNLNTNIINIKKNKIKNDNFIYFFSPIYNQLYLQTLVNNIYKINNKLNKYNLFDIKYKTNIIQSIDIIDNLLNLKQYNKLNFIAKKNYFISNFFMFNILSNKIKKKYIIKENFLINNYELIYSNQYLKFNNLNLNEYLIITYNYNKLFKNNYKSTYDSLINSYYLLLNSFYYQYKKQNIILNLKNFELLLKKIINYVKIINIGSSNYNINDIITFHIINILNLIYKKNRLNIIYYNPVILNFNQLSKNKTSNLCSISFQNTLKFVISNTISKSYDWLNDIKSNIISNNLIPFSDNWIYKFKN